MGRRESLTQITQDALETVTGNPDIRKAPWNRSVTNEDELQEVAQLGAAVDEEILPKVSGLREERETRIRDKKGIIFRNTR